MSFAVNTATAAVSSEYCCMIDDDAIDVYSTLNHLRKLSRFHPTDGMSILHVWFPRGAPGILCILDASAMVTAVCLDSGGRVKSVPVNLRTMSKNTQTTNCPPLIAATHLKYDDDVDLDGTTQLLVTIDALGVVAVSSITIAGANGSGGKNESSPVLTVSGRAGSLVPLHVYRSAAIETSSADAFGSLKRNKIILSASSTGIAIGEVGSSEFTVLVAAPARTTATPHLRNHRNDTKQRQKWEHLEAYSESLAAGGAAASWLRTVQRRLSTVVREALFSQGETIQSSAVPSLLQNDVRAAKT